MSYCENRNRIPWIGLVLGFALSLAFLQPSLQAQAILLATSDAPAAAENNRAARAGDLLFFVSAGTTGVGIVVIDYGLPIAEEGRVSGQAGEAIEEVDAEAGTVSLRIPAGMTVSDSVTVEGFRFDMTASETRSVVANLSVSGDRDFSSARKMFPWR